MDSPVKDQSEYTRIIWVLEHLQRQVKDVLEDADLLSKLTRDLAKRNELIKAHCKCCQEPAIVSICGYCDKQLEYGTSKEHWKECESHPAMFEIRRLSSLVKHYTDVKESTPEPLDLTYRDIRKAVKASGNKAKKHK